MPTAQPDITEVLDAYAQAKQARDEADERIKELKGVIDELLSEQQGTCTIGRYDVTRVEAQGPKRIDVKRLRAEMPEVADKYTVGSRGHTRIVVQEAKVLDETLAIPRMY